MSLDWKELAERLYAQGDFEGALSAWSLAEETVSLDAVQWHKRGIALRRLERYKEAVQAFDRSP